MEIKDKNQSESGYKIVIDIFGIVGLLGMIFGFFGFMSAHVHITPHGPDLSHCLSSFGRGVFIYSVPLLVCAAALRFLPIKSVKFKILNIISIILFVGILLLAYEFFIDIINNSCSGNGIPPQVF